MKKLFLPLTLGLVAIFALLFFTFSDFNKFVSNQMAQVIGINISQVMQWQIQYGLNNDLAVGDSGRDVRLLQYAMNKALPDFPSANITGYFGPQTSQAVSDFQKMKGLKVTGVLDPATRQVLNDVYFAELCPDGQGNQNGLFPDEILVHVNKDIPLPVDYIPKNLVDVSPIVKTIGIICLKSDLTSPLRQMFKDALKNNIDLAINSGFRRFEIQSSIFSSLLSTKGEQERNRVAEPLHSEHQLGTTLDLTGASIGNIGASDKFNGTPEDIWLRQNAYKYGFVQSYPKNKTSITGYDYEPWHYRYMGTDVAKTIFDKQESVEEYFASIKQ